MLALNGQSFPGVFTRDPNAELPKSTFTYSDWQEQQKALTVPQTFPQNMTPSGLSYSWKKVNGTMTCVLENPRGTSTWNNSEIFAPPEEYLAKQDVERQKAEERNMIAGLSDEQKKLLAKLERGELFGKSKLIEESMKKT